MANNLHVSYDLIAPEKNYEAVIAAVKSLGAWARVHQSFWYVSSSHTAAQAVEIVWKAMDANDKIYIVDTTNNTAAWQNLPANVSDFVKNQWNK